VKVGWRSRVEIDLDKLVGISGLSSLARGGPG
jgi:hypothetical protein